MRFFKVIDYGVYRIYHEEAGKGQKKYYLWNQTMKVVE